MPAKSRKVIPQAPRGRDEVKEAVLRAADTLFGQRGPDAVSIRDVAALANVNHALVHRHFGSKERLLHEVLLGYARSFREGASAGADALTTARYQFEVARKRPAFVKLVAHLLLNGHEPREFIVAEGGIAHLASVVAKEHAEQPVGESQLTAVTTAALFLGWAFFAPFLLDAAGFEGTEDEAAAHVERALERSLETGETRKKRRAPKGA